MFEAFLIHDEIGAKRIQKNKQVMAAKLDWGSGQEYRRFCMIAEKSYGPVGIGLLITDMMRFIHDHEIETWRRIQIQETLSGSSLALSP